MCIVYALTLVVEIIMRECLWVHVASTIGVSFSYTLVNFYGMTWLCKCLKISNIWYCRVFLMEKIYILMLNDKKTHKEKCRNLHVVSSLKTILLHHLHKKKRDHLKSMICK